MKEVKIISRKCNLKIELNKKLDKLLRIGESRYEAKRLYKTTTDHNSKSYNNLKAPHIYSIKTANTYREVINMVAEIIRKEYPDIWKTKDISKIDKELCYKILRNREADGKSAYTISRDMAALNKVLDLNLTKKEGGLAKRSYKMLTRSRNNTNANLSNRLKEKNARQITIAEATGIRRQSMLKITPRSFIYKKGKPVMIYVIEKGGRARFAHILESQQDEVKKILEGRDRDKPLFNYYSKKIDNHSYRAIYAENRYGEIEQQEQAKGHILNENYRGRDPYILSILTRDLGHQRISVCVEHYLGK